MEFDFLGKGSLYPEEYDPGLIQAVERKRPKNMPNVYYGFDLWWAYEISWLNPKSKPIVATAEIIFPANSKKLIESKSFKLYLNSLNMKKFDNVESVIDTIKSDLEKVYDMPVSVVLNTNLSNSVEVKPKLYDCIDQLDVECNFDQIDKSNLCKENYLVNERLVSHLLKSNCLVTNQPDWGSLFLDYVGHKINHQGLLKYIVSYRNHNGFHEHCVDQCFSDISESCQPESLIVHAQYTRRGGLDINPVRSNKPIVGHKFIRTFRQ